MIAPRIPPPLDLKVAKDELKRIDVILEKEKKNRSLLLVGGLAVQQYHDPRASRDIDLVASYETIRQLVDALYDTMYWRIRNQGTDDRPSLEIEDKSGPITVYFGAKLYERGEYNMVPWESIGKPSKPFRFYGDMYLQHIRIPLPHALAYSKIISFLGRYSTQNKAKAVADLRDFVNLSNHDEFCISGLFNLIRQNNAKQYIQAEMAKLAEHSATRAEILAVLRYSCVSYFANICPGRQAHGDGYNQSMQVGDAKQPKRLAYFAAPHKNVQHNAAIAYELGKVGIGVKLPHDEVERVYGIGMPSSPRVRQVCIDAILSSDWLIVDADRYGLDCAWEIGFADGLGKYVIGLNEDLSLMSEPRMINRRQCRDNFMHGWDERGGEQPIFSTVQQVAELFWNKVIYICGPFKNNVLLSNIKQGLENRVKKVIFPMDYVPDDTIMPKDYPLRTRANAIHQIDASDVMLVVLPRYGMDSSWQIGYATAKKKEIIGIMASDDNAESVSYSLWDHWMHGWREKDILTGVPKLRAAMKGFIDAGII